MNAHTPTPWQVIPKHDHGNINYKIANESYTWIIAEMKADNDIDTQENNAKFIVKAVNMHDELVSTLEACRNAFSTPEKLNKQNIEIILSILNLIISKAKEV